MPTAGAKLGQVYHSVGVSGYQRQGTRQLAECHGDLGRISRFLQIDIEARQG